MLEFHGENTVNQVLGCTFYPDWDLDWPTTPYDAIADTTETDSPADKAEIARRLRDLAANRNRRLLKLLRQYSCYHEATFRGRSARHFLLALADYLENGTRDPLYITEQGPSLQGDDYDVVTDLGGAWSVDSAFDTREQYETELGRAADTPPALRAALSNEERPDIPTLRVRLPDPCGTVTLNDGRRVRGRTAVVLIGAIPGMHYIQGGYLEAEVDDRPDPREQYPLLHLFLDGYLHQAYMGSGGEWPTAFGRYLDRRTLEERRRLVEEITRLLSRPAAEQTDVIIRCHSYFVPSRVSDEEQWNDTAWLRTLAEQARRDPTPVTMQ